MTSEDDEIERHAKAQLIADMVELEGAIDTFLCGEIRTGLITSFKLTLIVQSRILLALVRQSKLDVAEVTVRMGDER